MKQSIQGKYNVNAIACAVLAAALYGISSPISKLLLKEVPPTLMAALLYLGAGIGMLGVNGIHRVFRREQREAKMTVKELPYIFGMIALDIAAPVLLMFGLSLTTAANASLLNNFEIVTTSLIALFFFKEAVGKRMWVAILLITASSFVLSIDDASSISFSIGSIFVLMACVCWGFENNCTRMLSVKDPRQIVVYKGLGSGAGALVIFFITGKHSSYDLTYIFITLVLGFVAYGLSIYFYLLAQRQLGAARTSSYYAAAPFIGVFISWLLFRDRITINFIIALGIMLLGTYFAVTELHRHMHVHIPISHEHKHNHEDGHHTHRHGEGFHGEHSHVHSHEAIRHTHSHAPDAHHQHSHGKKPIKLSKRRI
ncbi:MAG TPA: EamA family transporter [Clostridiales bacterium]|nr:EamA family transporter [Clostridiales bacterium]